MTPYLVFLFVVTLFVLIVRRFNLVSILLRLPQKNSAKELGRNEKCHCGSGIKYKNCCLSKDEQIEDELLQQEKASAMNQREVVTLQGDPIKAHAQRGLANAADTLKDFKKLNSSDD